MLTKSRIFWSQISQMLLRTLTSLLKLICETWMRFKQEFPFDLSLVWLMCRINKRGLICDFSYGVCEWGFWNDSLMVILASVYNLRFCSLSLSLVMFLLFETQRFVLKQLKIQQTQLFHTFTVNNELCAWNISLNPTKATDNENLRRASLRLTPTLHHLF